MNGNYYIFTTPIYDTLDKDKIYSRYYDNTKENVVLLATQALTEFTKEFTTDTDTLTYITNNQSNWPVLDELSFEEEYIPRIDD